MSRVRRVASFLAGRLDGLALTGLAAFLGWLVLAGDYWLYLNPKFKPVTATAAVILAGLGLFALWRPVARPSLGRGLCYLAVFAMIGLTEGGTQAISGLTDSDPFQACPLPPAAATGPAAPERLTMGDTTYVPLNAGELYDIAAKGHGPAYDRPYVLRGFVHRSPELTAKGQFVIWRLAVWCCFADATAVGFRVTPPPGVPLPGDKSWLVVYGRLTDAPPGQRQEYPLPGMPFSSINPAALLAAEHLVPATAAPEDTAMYQWRQQAPYAY
jgi:uncharacterized repeat protein (TIGR03943 family)